MGLIGLYRPTLVERLVGSFGLSYLLGCLAVAVLIQLVFFSANYFETLNLGEAWRLYLGNDLAAAPLTALGLLVLGMAYNFYSFYSVGYIRRKVLAAKSEVAPLLPEGEESFTKLFRHISSRVPVVVTVVVLLTLIASVILFPNPQFPRTFWATFAGIFASIFFLLATVTLGWVYATSIWGLYRAGKESQNLKAYREDKMLGLKPLGSLSLALTFAYFIGVGLLTVYFSLGAPSGLLILPLGLIVVGIGTFFLPLDRIHRKMVEGKERELATIRSQLASMAERAQTGVSAGIEARISELISVLTLQSARQEVDSLPTWPFDTAILGRFVAVLLTVLGILIATYLKIPLGLK